LTDDTPLSASRHGAGAAALRFLDGDGHAATTIRSHDWAASPLGPPDHWPQSLRTAIRLMLNTRHPLFIFWGADGICFFNDAFGQSIGAERRATATGRPAREVWQEIWDVISPQIDQVMAGRGATWHENQLVPITRDGRREDVFWTYGYGPIDDESTPTGVGGVLVIATETTAQVQAARRSAEERTRQQRLLQQMPGFVAVLSGPTHVYQYVNDAYVAISGRRAILGRTVRDVFPELEGQGFFELLDQVYATGSAYAARESPILLAGDSECRFIDLLYEPIRGETGDVTGIFVGGYDVTERVRADVRLRQASERVQLALDAGAIVGTWIWEVPADRITADERFARYFSLDEELCRSGLGLEQVIASIHDDDRQRVAAAIAEAVSRGGPYMCQFRVRQQDGSSRWVEANGRVEFDREGRANRFPGVLIDIEDRRAVEAERDRAMALLQTFTEAVPGVAYAKDRQGRMLVANRGATELIGKPPSFYIGRTDAEFLDDPEQADAVMKTDRRIMETGVAEQVEERVTRPDGRPATWLSTKAPLRSADGAIIGLIGASIDITERKQAEAELKESREALRQLNETLERRVADAIAEREQAQEALRQSQKLDSMGQLTGGVAHDFNNLLTPIIGSLDMLIRRGVGSERERRLIDGAMQSAERAKTLVQRLLAFARRQPLQATPIDLPQLIHGMADIVASTSGPRVKVEVNAPKGLPRVKADPNQLEMAILNLSVNARDAMPDGGRLIISAEAARIGPGHRSKAPPGDYVGLTVSDTGLGMDEATLARAIEPFFSTKGIGKGTGLGLSMVHGLASQLGGALTIRSRPGVGTSVELWLPVAALDVCEDRPPDPTTAFSTAGTVLLVDDEDLVRASTSEMLQELGYHVTEAGSAEAALMLIDGGLTPDFVVTDHLMPGLTGTDLAYALRARWIDRVLIVSGYAEDEGVSAELPRLTKPFRQTELAAALAGINTPSAISPEA
jgi:PAS domain S-box-containing protein